MSRIGRARTGALSDNREPNAAGDAPSVGSTVDVENATYTNSIGDPELAGVAG
jgi:hypothetical protein